MDTKETIQFLMKNATEAQIKFEKFNQQQVDAIVKAVARVVYDNAVELARLAIDETQMGVFEDKIKKNRGKANIIWNSLKDKKSVGILNYNEKIGVVEVAKPMGVIGMVTPCTNPIVTPMCNAMFALKGRNSIIIAPHPKAKKCARRLVDLFNEAIGKLDAPENLIQVIDEPSVELSMELMRCVDVIVATGGMPMVKAAYSSGKPAYGVGVGNVQCIIDRNVDIKTAVSKIVTGRTFDNGIICSGEQAIIIHEDDYEEVVNELKANGAYYIEDGEEKEKLRQALFIDGITNRHLVGKPASKVAEYAGINLPGPAKLIAVRADGVGKADILSKEKMCPVIATFKYRTFVEAVDIAIANLEVEGKGHTIAIHSDNKENIEYAATTVHVCRVLVNQIGATMNGGSFFNGFIPTTTLGCGSWGNNSISENLGYENFINITRIGYLLTNVKEPTEQEIWE